MNVFRIHLGRGEASDAEAVEGVTVWQGPDAWLGAAFGRIFGGAEIFELCIGRTDFIVDCRDDGIVQALAISFRHGIREFRNRMAEWACFPRRLGDGFALCD